MKNQSRQATTDRGRCFGDDARVHDGGDGEEQEAEAFQGGRGDDDGDAGESGREGEPIRTRTHSLAATGKKEFLLRFGVVNAIH